MCTMCVLGSSHPFETEIKIYGGSSLFLTVDITNYLMYTMIAMKLKKIQGRSMALDPPGWL